MFFLEVLEENPFPGLSGSWKRPDSLGEGPVPWSKPANASLLPLHPPQQPL